MNYRSNESTGKKAGTWFALVGFLVVLGWRALVMTSQYVHEPQIVRELCRIPQFEQDINPNSINTRLVYCQDTDEGVGIYFSDLSSGKPRLLCEQKEKGGRGRRFTMLGWSPDDSLFACAFPENKQDEELILIFDGKTGELLNKVVADPSFNEFGWLSNESFAYSVGDNSVRVVTRQANGDWSHKRFFENVATNMNNFTAISANSVAWRDGNGIGMLHLDTGVSERIWEANTNNLMEFTYDLASGVYLLNCTDDDGQYLMWFRRNEKHAINLGPISSHHAYIRKATWKHNGSNYAYVTNDSAGSAFGIKTADLDSPAKVQWQGGVRSCTFNEGHLFFSGNAEDQPPGIWDYDLKSQTFKCIIASTSGPLDNNLGAPSALLLMTNSLSQQRFCHVWAPPHFSPNKKYPVLLAQELNTWFPCFQIAAQSGYYVAVVDRPFFNTWDGEPEQTWIEDVSSLYKIMAQNPNIDTNHVYLYACSRETGFLSELMDEKPTLANGAILFSPTTLPDVSIIKNRHILIVDGKSDGNAIKRLPDFLSRAAQNGNEITLFLQDDAGHIAASSATERNQDMRFAAFMLNQ